MRRRTQLLLVAAAVMASVAGGAAWATPGTPGVVATTWARGTMSPHFRIKLHESSKPADAVVQQVTIPPGGFTGWHTHPGPAIVIVKSGRLTVYDAPSGDADHGDDASQDGGNASSCSGTTYTAGQILLDQGYGHVHIGHNPDATTPTELWITFLDVPPGTSPRIDAASPGNCPF